VRACEKLDGETLRLASEQVRPLEAVRHVENLLDAPPVRTTSDV
jgi:hypothetical protein